MKYIKFFLIFLIPLSNTSNAQDGAVAFTGGITSGGFGSLISYNYYWDRYQTDFIQGSILLTNSYQKTNDIKVPYNEFTLNIGYYKNIFENRSGALKIAAGVGGVFGYEAVNNGNNELPDGSIILSNSNFIYGAFAGLDIDIFLTDKYSLVLKANEYYHANSKLGEFMPYIGTGVRIFLDY